MFLPTLHATVLLFLLAVPPLYAARPIRQRLPDFSQDEAPQHLAQILSGEVHRQDAAATVHRIGEMGWQELRPMLHEVAVSAAKDPKYQTVAFDALHALWVLGESREYFVARAKAHEENSILAYYAMSILARTPDDEIRQLMIQVGKESKDSGVQSQAGQAAYVHSIIESYQKKPTFGQQVDLLLEHAGRGSECTMDGVPFNRYDPNSSLSAVSVWCRQELARVAAEQPLAVALHVAQADVEKLLDMPGLPAPERVKASLKFQQYIVESLPESARRAYQAMSANAPPPPAGGQPGEQGAVREAAGSTTKLSGD